MRSHIRVLIAFALIAIGSGFDLKAGRAGASEAATQDVASQIIAREKASFVAWQNKDKAFYADYWADDFTEFLPSSPYLDSKKNLMAKFDELVDHWKIVDFQMYNARVQVYGNTAILTYNESISGTYDGQPSTYTGKVTMVYVKQGNTWRGAHYHESMNAGSK